MKIFSKILNVLSFLFRGNNLGADGSKFLAEGLSKMNALTSLKLDLR